MNRVAVVACVPAVVVALIGAWGAVANPTGGWVWPPDDVNVSEAVATRNYAEVVRLLDNGADPTRPNPVRGSLLASRPVVAIPVEAAVMARNAAMLGLLFVGRLWQRYRESSTELPGNGATGTTGRNKESTFTRSLVSLAVLVAATGLAALAWPAIA